MSPDTLASLLAANPYPGCEIARGSDSILLGFDGLALNYRADGWHFGGTHLESTLSEHSAPEQVHPEIRRILKVVMSLKVERALNEAEADGATDPVAYLTDLAAEKMLAILDVAALANARQAEIGRLSADVALLKTAPPIKTGEGGASPRSRAPSPTPEPRKPTTLKTAPSGASPTLSGSAYSASASTSSALRSAKPPTPRTTSTPSSKGTTPSTIATLPASPTGAS